MFDLSVSSFDIFRDFDDLERVDTIDLRPTTQEAVTDGFLLMESGDQILLEDASGSLLLE